MFSLAAAYSAPPTVVFCLQRFRTGLLQRVQMWGIAAGVLRRWSCTTGGGLRKPGDRAKASRTEPLAPHCSVARAALFREVDLSRWVEMSQWVVVFDWSEMFR